MYQFVLIRRRHGPGRSCSQISFCLLPVTVLNFSSCNWLSDELRCVCKHQACFTPRPPTPQVDNNVTRHLDSTLKRDDWDMLILHYLGLDHIGHISGPYSSLIQPKLVEMDDVLKKIHGALISKVSPPHDPRPLRAHEGHKITIHLFIHPSIRSFIHQSYIQPTIHPAYIHLLSGPSFHRSASPRPLTS